MGSKPSAGNVLLSSLITFSTLNTRIQPINSMPAYQTSQEMVVSLEAEFNYQCL